MSAVEPRMTSERQETPDYEQADEWATWTCNGPQEEGLRDNQNLARAYLALRTREAVAAAKCATCKGTGTVPDAHGPSLLAEELPCYDCGGIGVVTHPPRAGEVTEEMVQRGVAASQHITDQYGSTTFVPRDVVQSILTAALERSS